MNEMNEMDPLEAQLRSWKLRHPSAALERRLFRHAPARPGPAKLAGWLVPVAAGLLFAGIILNPQANVPFPSSARSGGMLALILSNQNYAAYLPGSFLRTHNQLETFPRAPGDGLFSLTNLTR